MKSLDTNILIYSANSDAPENSNAQKLVEQLLNEPDEWIIAEQVLIEFYRSLRNPAIFERPIGPGQAFAMTRFFREEAGCGRCCYGLEMWPRLELLFRSPRFDARRTLAAVLAVTLLANGVDTFYSRNTRDFLGFGFENLVNPID